MPLTPEDSRTMRRIIAEVLKISPDRVIPEANFFRDLGGSFDHLMPMRLETEAAFGVDITAITDRVNAKTRTSGGQLRQSSLKAIGDYLGLTFDNEPKKFLDLFTVAFIEAITAKAIEKRPKKAAAPAGDVRFSSFSRAADVRSTIGRLLNCPADQLSSETDLSQMDGLILAALFAELDARWGTRVAQAVEEIAAATRCDARGRLTRASRQTLAGLLPGVDFTAGASASFLNRLGLLEAIVERDATAESPTTRAQPIFRLPADVSWTADTSRPLIRLQQSLGDRQTRRVLAECCRIANLAGTPWSALADQCIDTLLQFAATGKGKRVMKTLSEDLKDWEREGVPLLKALAVGLRAELPKDLLVSAAQALSVAENLTQKQAVLRVQTIAANL